MPVYTYTHGGDYPEASGVLDFSVNLNPLGPPPEVVAAARAAAARPDRYPDALCRALRAGIAVRDGVKPEEIVCGDGAAELIFRLVSALRPRKALVVAPTFSEYEAALRAYSCEVNYHQMGEGFLLTDGILNDLMEDLDLCFLCNPNNPTGMMIAPWILRHIADRCLELNIRLVVDETFIDLAELEYADLDRGMAGWIGAYPNLVLLRAFTKSYAIPGLRLGYCLSGDEALIKRLYACQQPWAVSGPAQAAGLAALERPDWPERARAFLGKERAFLQSGLEALGLEVTPGTANFLLFRAAGREDLKEALFSRGILIRACGNFHGLGPDYYRVAIRAHGDNLRLLAALEGEITSHG